MNADTDICHVSMGIAEKIFKVIWSEVKVVAVV